MGFFYLGQIGCVNEKFHTIIGVGLRGNKKWQAYYIAPLNHLLLLPSGPGRVQQELAV